MKWIMNTYRRQVLGHIKKLKDQYGVEIGDPLPFNEQEGLTKEELLEMDLVGIYKPSVQELELMRHFGLIYNTDDLFHQHQVKNEVYIIEED